MRNRFNGQTEVTCAHSRSVTANRARWTRRRSYSLSVSGIEYNRECDEMESLSKAGRVFMISPSRPIEASNMESDMEKLGGLYHMGYDDAVNAMGALKSYLGI